MLVIVNDSTAAYSRLQCKSVTVEWLMVSYIANQCYVQGSTGKYSGLPCRSGPAYLHTVGYSAGKKKPTVGYSEIQ